MTRYAFRRTVPRSAARAALALLTVSFLAGAAWSATPSKEVQIAGALLAAPEEMREGATVLGWVDGQLTTVRDGEGELVCLADDPGADGFNAACYHESLEPFMARGRELRAQGVSGRDRQQKRFEEIENGTLPMPREGRMLYVLSGDSYDEAAGEVVNGSTRWVIYMPYATAASTGFSTTPQRGAPWLMGEGTPGAHVMITPPN